MTPESSAGDLSSLRISRDKKKAPEGMSPRSRIILAVVICAVLGVAGFLFFRGGVSPTAEVEMTSAVMTSPSQASAVLTASGYVVAQQRAAVASKGTGRLVYLGVEEGDRVKKGQILARIEDADMVAGLDRARANLEVAQAEYDDAERTFKSDAIPVQSGPGIAGGDRRSELQICAHSRGDRGGPGHRGRSGRGVREHPHPCAVRRHRPDQGCRHRRGGRAVRGLRQCRAGPSSRWRT